ncbi:hypothetical protein [Candidatus Nitrotoga sp. AM1P]|uniref:hypothetical protein n=1 Tax=Candidatus Nitrotoga sp. AM1P TaxID=2559597 RepID=UPI0015635FBB|nr:hypothetical protein [Candidatus Nitrotoga sp. AM1P]
MNKLDYSIRRISFTFTLFIVICIFCGQSYAKELQPGSGAVPGDSELQSGQKFEIVGELYAIGVTDDPRSGKLSFIALHQFRIRGHEIVSRQLVPIGSILTIVDKKPKKRAFFVFPYPDRYVVHINTIDAPAGISIVLRLEGGIEGKSTPLNPLIFKPLLGQ